MCEMHKIKPKRCGLTLVLMSHKIFRLPCKHLHHSAWSALGHLRCLSLSPWHGVRRQQIPTHRSEISVGYLGGATGTKPGWATLTGEMWHAGFASPKIMFKFCTELSSKHPQFFVEKGAQTDVLPVPVWLYEHTENSKTPSTPVCAIRATENFGAFRGAKWPYQHFPCLWKMCLKVTRPKNNILEYV